MYTHYFSLKSAPFSIAPDPRYLFMSERHREALAHLLYGIGSGGGFVLLTGEIGAGKTTVVRCLLEQLPATCVVAYVFNPKLTALELLQTVCHEFGIDAAVRDVGSIKAHVDALNAFLLQAHARGQQALLVIDEVGYIPFEPEAANLFFQLVSSRYERASLIVTSNKPFGRWGEVFGDDVVAAAMIDRLVHHAEVVSLRGDSYRLKNRDLGRVPADTADPE